MASFTVIVPIPVRLVPIVRILFRVALVPVTARELNSAKRAPMVRRLAVTAQIPVSMVQAARRDMTRANVHPVPLARCVLWSMVNLHAVVPTAANMVRDVLIHTTTVNVHLVQLEKSAVWTEENQYVTAPTLAELAQDVLRRSTAVNVTTHVILDRNVT